MDPAAPSDEVLDLIGSGAAPARNEALRKLNALLVSERDRVESLKPAGELLGH